MSFHPQPQNMLYDKKVALLFHRKRNLFFEQKVGVDVKFVEISVPSKWNGMLGHSLGGEVFFFFAALHCSLLELKALFVLLTWNYYLLHSRGTWEAIRAVIRKHETFDIIWGKKLFLINCGPCWIWGQN